MLRSVPQRCLASAGIVRRSVQSRSVVGLSHISTTVNRPLASNSLTPTRTIHSTIIAQSKPTKSTTMSSTVPTTPHALSSPTISYVTGDQLTSGSNLQAVSFFLTADQLTSLQGANKSDSITIEAILGAPCGLFQGAAPFAPASFQDFKADASETLWLYPAADTTASKKEATTTYPRILLVGLGAANAVNLSTYRTASYKAISAFQSLLLTRVGLVLPPPPLEQQQRFFDSHFQNELVSNITRIAILSEHYFRRYLSVKQMELKKKKPMEQIQFIDLQHATGASTSSPKSKKTSTSTAASSTSSDHSRAISTQSIIASATIAAREWANERGDVATPAFMEAEARAIASKHKLKLTVLQDADLAKEGLNLIRAVGQAGTHKARLVLLEYRGDPSSTNTTALVGKGITFDTGGLLLKGRGNIEGMHLDMSGSAAVLGVMQALPQLGLKTNVVGVLALAENAISHESYKPLAILQSAKGSVEIIDTDAEGRLALADAMTYVQRVHKPNKMVDLATLTGAAVVALGEHIAASFSNSDSFSAELSEASKQSGERTWRLPIEGADELKSTYADFTNCATHRWGGACTAAAFLEKFVEPGVDWIHLDIAGPAMIRKSKEWLPEGGTGFGVCLLLQYFLQQQLTSTTQLTAKGLGGFSQEQLKEALSQFKESP